MHKHWMQFNEYVRRQSAPLQVYTNLRSLHALVLAESTMKGPAIYAIESLVFHKCVNKYKNLEFLIK